MQVDLFSNCFLSFYSHFQWTCSFLKYSYACLGCNNFIRYISVVFLAMSQARKKEKSFVSLELRLQVLDGRLTLGWHMVLIVFSTSCTSGRAIFHNSTSLLHLKDSMSPNIPRALVWQILFPFPQLCWEILLSQYYICTHCHLLSIDWDC